MKPYILVLVWGCDEVVIYQPQNHVTTVVGGYMKVRIWIYNTTLRHCCTYVAGRLYEGEKTDFLQPCGSVVVTLVRGVYEA